MNGQYLTFFVDGEEYALGILRVKEIIEYSGVTRVPMMPTHVRGVINLRGSVVPVVDLALKFGLKRSEPTKLTCIVVVELELDGRQTVMGVMADAVSQVIELADGDIEAPPSFGTRVSLDYLTGMGKAEGKLVLVLDIDRVLTSEELAALMATGEPDIPVPGGEQPNLAA
jgi:purine-binding chemotaxis protein CheW